MNEINRLVCFSDETGQDSKGKFFLVSACVINAKNEKNFEDLLADIEIKSNKKFRKWKDSSNIIRKVFLDSFFTSKFPVSSLFYAKYNNSLEYIHLIALTIAQAILKKSGDNYTVKIFFDRINKKSEQKIKNELKKLKIKFKKVRGMKDESFALIRLTDTMCGLIRDYLEDKHYTIRYKKYIEKINVL
ncbi:MAG: DUF3800 domain-containing protein [bacterium]|nr:DUF3800 domain-containing protein [bacterium]